MTSNKRVLSVGVPQESILGPVLYLMFTSPLSDVISIGNSMICSDIWHKYHE